MQSPDSRSKMMNVQGRFKLLLCWEMVIVKWRESRQAFHKVSKYKVQKQMFRGGLKLLFWKLSL